MTFIYWLSSVAMIIGIIYFIWAFKDTFYNLNKTQKTALYVLLIATSIHLIIEIGASIYQFPFIWSF